MTAKPPGSPPEPPTTRRAEVETARRTSPVQTVRANLKAQDGGDEAIRLLAEAVRRLLHRG